MDGSDSSCLILVCVVVMLVWVVCISLIMFGLCLLGMIELLVVYCVGSVMKLNLLLVNSDRFYVMWCRFRVVLLSVFSVVSLNLLCESCV